MTSPTSRNRWIACSTAALLLAAGAVAWKLTRPGPSRDGPFLARPAAFVRDIAKSEEACERSAGSVKSSFLKGLRERDWEKAGSGLTSDFRGKFPGPSDGTAVPDEGMTLREFAGGALPELDGPAFLDALRAHVQSWSFVERTTWRTFTFLLYPDEKRAYVQLHFQLAGPSPDGARNDLQAVLDGELVREGDSWKVRRLALAEGCAVRSAIPPFADITDATGFHFNESEENRRASQQIINNRSLKTAGGLAAVDWNRDGFWDLLATFANRRTVLFVNDGRGGFAREENIVGAPEEAAYMFASADLDGDGVEELAGTQILSYRGNRAEMTLFSRRTGAWERVPGALPFEVAPGRRALLAQSIVPYDVDGDGDLDLFYGVYSDSESGKDRYNALAAFDGAANYLFINQGGLRFTEESAARGLHGTQYTLAAQFFDFDFDGDPDLLEGNDFGPDVVWENLGKGRFREAKGHVLARDATYTMGIAISDWDNTGAWSVHISNMYSHAGNRIVPLAEGLGEEIRQVSLMIAMGNQMFEYDAAARAWSETAVRRGINWADWAWACLFVDFDNDTDKELFVANGYTSFEDSKAPDW